MEKYDSVAGGDGEIGMAVIIVVAHGAAHSFTLKFETRRFGDILEFSFTDVAIKRRMAPAIGVDQENIGAAITIVIKDASPAAEKMRERFWRVLGIFFRDQLGACLAWLGARNLRLGCGLEMAVPQWTDIDEMDGNGGRSRL